MKKSVAQSCLLVLTSTAIALSIASDAPAQNAMAATRQADRAALQSKAFNDAQALDAEAQRRGIPARGKSARGENISLSGFVNGRPIYDAPVSVNGVSLNVKRVHEEFPESSLSNQFILGIWDEAGVRANHPELSGRVGNIDSIFGWISDHATGVAGVAAAAGVDPGARGMVPSTFIHAYDMRDDLLEMTSRAAEVPLQSGSLKNILVSNHSYGEYVGWGQARLEVDPGIFWQGWYWFGEANEREDRRFGQYTQRASDWDALVQAAPYFLPVRAAGNDRTEGHLSAGTSFRYWNASTSKWVLKAYDPTTDPLPDNQKAGGFDTIGTFATAKNILTVGSVSAAVSSDTRLAESARMSNFSSWGPTDDGRIKPDLVAVGEDVMTLWGSGSYVYASGSGTSFSAPAVSGASMLLQQIHALSAGDPMLASGVKALLIHSACDMGTAGPDYKFGWGLINALAAADILDAHLRNTSTGIVQTQTLSEGGVHEYRFNWDGSSPIRATLAWTDPAGSPKTGLNDRTPVLINDLDLRVIAPNSTTYLPFMLDPANPAAPAFTGNNIIDNVEQVLIDAPIAGQYIVRVSHKGNLLPPQVKGKKQPGTQEFSLIVTGQTLSDITVTAAGDEEVLHVLGSSAPRVSWTVSNTSSATKSWAVENKPEWLTLDRLSGSLAANQSVTLTGTVNSSAPEYGPGRHNGEVVIVDVASNCKMVRRVSVDAWRPATLNSIEDFESGQLADTWRVTGVGQPRATVRQELGPVDSYHLVLDDYMTGGARSRVEVTTLLDLAGWDDLFMTFDAKSFHEPTIGPHANPYLGGSQTTGIALSADGHLWHEVHALRGSNITRSYTTRSLDLAAALASTDMADAEYVYLRFSTFVRNPADIDTNMAGLALDNIAITGVYTEPVPTEPAPTEPEPTEPEPTDPEPTDPEPTDPEPTDPVPTDPEPTDPEPTDPEPTDPEPTPTKGNSGKGGGKKTDSSSGEETTDTRPNSGKGNNK